MANKYIHKKTGKPYSIVSNNFMMKKDGKWIKDLILYKAEYNNPDGEYFARTREDFFENFSEKKPATLKLYKWIFHLPDGVVISPETGRYVKPSVTVYEHDFETCIGEFPDYNDLEILETDLLYKTEEEVKAFVENNLDPY